MDTDTHQAHHVDVSVIGGGPAGRAAALVLARSRRSVVVIDAGEPRNRYADGVHSFLTREGSPPGDILRLGRDEVTSYGGELRGTLAVSADVQADGPVVLGLEDGSTVTARRVIVASGIADRLPEIPGLSRFWGTDVVHCPFCHGYEVADRRIAVLATGPAALHQATLFRHLTDDLTLLTHVATNLDETEVEQLRNAGISIVNGEVAAVVGDEHLTAVELADGTTIEVGALVIAPRFDIAAPLLTQLGLDLTEHPSGLGLHIKAGPAGETNVPQIWAAGNVTDPSAQVVTAIAQGNTTGARVHYDLLIADLPPAS